MNQRDDAMRRHDQACQDLAREAGDFIWSRLARINGTQGRGMSDLEDQIYSWLLVHGEFDRRNA